MSESEGERASGSRDKKCEARQGVRSHVQMEMGLQGVSQSWVHSCLSTLYC